MINDVWTFCATSKADEHVTEPILFIIEVESNHQRDPPQNVCNGCRSSVVVYSRNETKRVTYHEEKADLAYLPAEGSRSEITLHLL